MMSVICVSNDEEVLNTCLLSSLKKQTVPYEFINVDNRNGRFSSAAAALNHGGRDAKGEYLMFVHQDVTLQSETVLADAERMMKSLPSAGIAGVAGKADDKGVMSNITHDQPPRPAGSIRIDKPEKVQTVDECLVIIPSAVFASLQFDEKAFDGWHMYTTDYSLMALERGLEVFVLPLNVHHYPSGRLDYSNPLKGYYESLRRLLRKHRKSFKRVHTSMGSWSTRMPLGLQLYVVRRRKRRTGPADEG
jgi:hypothetical protein